MQQPPGQASGAVAPAPVAPSPVQAGSDGEWLSAPAFAATGLALLLAGGWVLQRRQRLARRTQQHPDAVPVEPQSAAEAPAESSPAPLEQNHHRHSHRIGVAAQKRLINGLMWVRTATGAAAILAAIAVVVFWSIETTERAGDTGLTMPLLVLLLVGWAASWAAGQLANQLHRAFFGRVHPKFDN